MFFFVFSIAKKEKAESLLKTCDLLSAVTDLLSFLLIVLPLYPENISGYIYSVSLPAYGEVSSRSLAIYWLIFATLIAAGIIRIVLAKLEHTRYRKVLSDLSIVLGIIAVAFLALSREAYAATLAFALLVVKGILMLKTARHIHGE